MDQLIEVSLPVTVLGSSNYVHEPPQALRFGRLEGGGLFEFSPNQSEQGVEGNFIYRGSNNRIPVSLKDKSNASLKNVFRAIRTNGKKVQDAGKAGLAIIHVKVPQFSIEEVLNHISASSSNILPGGVFHKIMLDCSDGVVAIDKIGIAGER